MRNTICCQAANVMVFRASVATSSGKTLLIVDDLCSRDSSQLKEKYCHVLSWALILRDLVTPLLIISTNTVFRETITEKEEFTFLVLSFWVASVNLSIAPLANSLSNLKNKFLFKRPTEAELWKLSRRVDTWGEPLYCLKSSCFSFIFRFLVWKRKCWCTSQGHAVM